MRAHDANDAVLLNQASDISHRNLGVALIVVFHQLDRPPQDAAGGIDLADSEFHSGFAGSADGSGRAGKRAVPADLNGIGGGGAVGGSAASASVRAGSAAGGVSDGASAASSETEYHGGGKKKCEQSFHVESSINKNFI